jgi:hypothetical protein
MLRYLGKIAGRSSQVSKKMVSPQVFSLKVVAPVRQHWVSRFVPNDMRQEATYQTTQ